MQLIRQGLALIASFSLVAGCTHFTPYYRGNQVRQVVPAADDEIDHRLLLIGDAGDPDPDGEPTLKLLAHQASQLPERTTVVFLGDNAYERGMPEPIKLDKPAEEAVDAAKDVLDVVLPDVFVSRQEAEFAMNAQIDALRESGAQGIFMPGNHDWDQFETGGWDRILALEQFVQAAAADGTVKVALIPSGGCPGPNQLHLGTKGELVILDTQWWLETRADGKPTTQNNPTKCEFVTEKQVREALLAQLEGAAKEKRHIVVAGHHPLESEGPHGGFTDVRTHLFPFQIVRHYVPLYISWIPLPVLGSMAVLARQYFSPSAQDTSNDRNRHLRNALNVTMRRAEENGAAPLAYAAGHDHSLQVFKSKHGPEYTLVSGMGSKARASDVGSNSDTLFAHSNPLHPGFMQMDFLKNGSVRFSVHEVDGDKPEGVEAFSFFMKPEPKGPRELAAQRGAE